MTTKTMTKPKDADKQLRFGGRAAVVDASANDVRMDADAQTVTFPLSSEEPYSRYYWKYGRDLDEVLSHKSSAVDLSWLNSGNAPVLDTHSRYELKNQIGVIEKAWIENERIYVTVRLSNAESDAATVSKIMDGIVRNVSVGYEIMKYEVNEDAGTFTATRWMPKEASFVPIPADPTVGVGRSDSERKEYQMSEKTKANGGASTAVINAVLPGGDTRTDEERAESMTNAINEITALGKQHNQQDLARSFLKGALERGTEPELALFKGIVAAQLPDGTPLVNTEIGMTEKERNSFSLLKVARKLADPNYNGAGFELEAMQAAAEQRGTDGTGAFSVPTDVTESWGRFTVDGREYRTTDMSEIQRSYQRMGIRAAIGTGGNPNVLTTDHMAERFIDNLRNQSSILRAGVTMMEGLSDNVEIPGGDQNIVAAWLASEDADAAESVPTFRKVTMSPNDVAAYTDMTRRMLQQSTIAMEAYVRSQLLEGHRVAIDSAGVYGSGASGVPTGVVNTTGIGAVDFATASQPTRNELIDIETAVDLTNRAGDVTHLINSTMNGHFRKTPVLAGGNVARFLSDEFGPSTIKSNQILGTDVVSGVWSDMAMGMWDGLQLDRSTEAKFLSGGLRLRSIQTVDFAVLRVGSFVLGRFLP